MKDSRTLLDKGIQLRFRKSLSFSELKTLGIMKIVSSLHAACHSLLLVALQGHKIWEKVATHHALGFL